MDKVYRFYTYNNTWWPDKYLWWQENCDAYLMMSSANFIDTLLDCLGPDPFNPKAETRSIIKTDTIHVDMDRLMRTNKELAQKTIRLVQDFDDYEICPTAIQEWLDELDDFVRGKIICE